MSTTITPTRSASLTRVGLPSRRGRLRYGALRAGALRTVASATVETPTRTSPPTGLAPMERRPPVSSLEALLRFAAVTEEMAAARGQLAFVAGRFGPPTPTETSRYLLAVFAQGTSGDVLPYWKMAALIRPLARFAVPGAESGLALGPARPASRAGVRPTQGGALRGRRLPEPRSPTSRRAAS